MWYLKDRVPHLNTQISELEHIFQYHDRKIPLYKIIHKIIFVIVKQMEYYAALEQNTKELCVRIWNDLQDV